MDYQMAQQQTAQMQQQMQTLAQQLAALATKIQANAKDPATARELNMDLREIGMGIAGFGQSAQLMLQRPTRARGHQHLLAAGLTMPERVLPGLIEIEPLVRMLHQRDGESARDEAGDQLIAVDREAVTVGLLLKGLVDPRLPVDQGPVAVESDEFDVFRQGHSGRGSIGSGAAAAGAF